MRKTFAAAGAISLALLFAVVMIVGWSVGRGAAASSGQLKLATAPVQGAAAHYYLTIDTPAMLGGSEDTGPAYVPGNLTLPADSDVTLTITNFDGATALPPAAQQYAKASGIEGAFAVQSIDDPSHPNVLGAPQKATSLDPVAGVSHTFTILKLGINVPLAPQSETTFTFHTAGAGTYDFRCMDPCGNGPQGWGAAMAAEGFMEGKIVFA